MPLGGVTEPGRFLLQSVSAFLQQGKEIFIMPNEDLSCFSVSCNYLAGFSLSMRTTLVLASSSDFRFCPYLSEPCFT